MEKLNTNQLSIALLEEENDLLEQIIYTKYQAFLVLLINILIKRIYKFKQLNNNAQKIPDCTNKIDKLNFIVLSCNQT